MQITFTSGELLVTYSNFITASTPLGYSREGVAIGVSLTLSIIVITTVQCVQSKVGAKSSLLMLYFITTVWLVNFEGLIIHAINDMDGFIY